MTQAALYGFISGCALIIGSIVGLYFKLPKHVIAWIMAFGCGVLISSLSIDLMTDAFEISSNGLLLTSGFSLGAIIYVSGNYFLSKNGGGRRRHTHSPNGEQNLSGSAIVLGTLLDGIPESLVMGSILSEGRSGGFIFIVAVFLSNFPEGISGTLAMKNSGISNLKIIGIWVLILIMIVASTLVGYSFLTDEYTNFRALAMAFASGTILAMLSDTMLPESYKEGGTFTALFVALGFILAFLLTKLL